jgi:adenylylsulfate reductase subunit B
MCCVKLCPQQAMDVRGYSDFVPMGASATPLRGSEDIMWTVKFRDGSIKRFKFPTRTTPEGSADPLGGFATHDDINSEALSTEPESAGLDAVPTVK